MRRLAPWLVLSTLAVPLAARADGSIQLTARAGVASPFGDVANGVALGDVLDWAYPLEAQLQFRFTRHLALGAYGRYAFTTLPAGCSDCTVSDVGFGAAAEVRFGERLEGGPWLGASFGWGMLKSDEAGASSTLSGFEGGVSAGWDFELGGLTLGPYLTASAGQYSKWTGSGSQSITDQGMHGFFGGGLRLALLL